MGAVGHFILLLIDFNLFDIIFRLCFKSRNNLIDIMIFRV